MWSHWNYAPVSQWKLELRKQVNETLLFHDIHRKKEIWINVRVTLLFYLGFLVPLIVSIILNLCSWGDFLLF